MASGKVVVHRLALPGRRFRLPTVVDACCSGSNVTLTVLSTVTNGVCPTHITRTWQATDCCSNTTVCSQTVTVFNAPCRTTLNVTIVGGEPCFSWAGPAVLEWTTSLSSPINWTPAANQSNPQCIDPIGSQRFFRLRMQ